MPPDRVRQRRRRVLGMLLMLVITALPLFLLVMWSRDRTTVLVHLRPAREAQAAFQSRIDHLGLLPAEAVELDKAGLYYLFSDPGDREYARQCRERLVIAHGAAISLYLANKSRIVMTCEKGKIEVSLMPSLELIHLLEQQTRNINAYFNKKTQ
ncbi:MAG TPA: hypothetical protein PKY77_09180 [Phycisphaerae bacterium]|nr:hypothetical protein [Phycisphaerae bacterium]HRY68367.1 hypothetical protein [Phycisphaerae bacterium]HSA28300.1 hypothetical protein [Phycisphaerae bacterium]